jgi:hypothetical protein
MTEELVDNELENLPWANLGYYPGTHTEEPREAKKNISQDT